MKTIIKTLFASLLITGSISAQSLTNTSKETTIEEYNFNNNEKIVTIKTIKSETQNLQFEKEDKGELNQNLDNTSINVTKEILIDNDEDVFYDKKLVVTYTKKNGEDEHLTYTNTPEGIFISEPGIIKNRNPLFLTEVGTYKVSDVTITIEDLNFVK